MIIKDFAINKYGPLSNTGSVHLTNFNLIFGKNENGKTLTIDAIIKFLLGKKASEFKNTDRVESDPKGHLTLISNNGMDENIFPDDGDLTKISISNNSNLTYSDCRNIFIIRNSELYLNNEASFYTDITERLVGLRTTDIRKIKNNLLDIGSLTSGFDYKNEKPIKLKSKIKDAEDLVNDINELRESLLKDEFDTLEIEFFNKKNEFQEITSLIGEYEDARLRVKYEFCSGLLNDLKNKISSLKNLEIFGDEDSQAWQESEREIKRNEFDINELKEKKDNLNNETVFLDEKTKELKNRLSSLEKRKGLLENKRLRIKGIKDAFIWLRSVNPLKSVLKRSTYLLTIIFSVIMVSAIMVTDSEYLFVTGLTILIITIIIWGIELFYILRERRIAKKFESMKLELKESGIKAETIDEMLLEIQKFDENYEMTIREQAEVESRKIALKRDMSEIEEKIRKNRKIIETEDKKIVAIKAKGGIQSLDEYIGIINKKRAIEKERDAVTNRLEGLLDVAGGSRGEKLKMFESRIAELESFKHKAEGIQFDKKIYAEIKNKKSQLEQEIEALQQKTNSYNSEMTEIERRTNLLDITNDERLYCKTLLDMNVITAKCNDFIQNNIDKKDEVIAAIQILDEIEMDEKKKVHELFGNSSPLTSVYNRITNGLYDDVFYDRVEETIKVKHRNGEILEPKKLSGGAYDQLYLAIRLTLGEQLLKTEKGFFILDDPFVKSDIERIERQMETLKTIAENGWQIIYFSAKKEIKDILSDDIQNGMVNYIEIDWLD